MAGAACSRHHERCNHADSEFFNVHVSENHFQIQGRLRVKLLRNKIPMWPHLSARPTGHPTFPAFRRTQLEPGARPH
jgi:hypothetical protein